MVEAMGETQRIPCDLHRRCGGGWSASRVSAQSGRPRCYSRRRRTAAHQWLDGREEEDGDIERLHETKSTIRAGNLEIDLSGRLARCNERALPLTGHELGILALLIEGVGTAWSFQELHAKVWGAPSHGDKSAVTSAVKRLRKKLAQAGSTRRIESIRGFGFRLV